MRQLDFWTPETEHGQRVVNVAEIPQRSPLRYPGGKTWLVPHVRAWLRALPRKPDMFVEPFVGGGIISLTVAFENLAHHVLMVELDRDVAAVWQTMLSEENDWLADRVASFDVSVESIREELSRTPPDRKHLAFRTLLRNRTHHGGILAAGSSVLKHGENGKGVRSRWYPQTLRKRIQNIKTIRDKVSFLHGDGIATIRQHAPRKTAVFFIDPPYTAGGKRAGTRLYTHNELDHAELFRQAERIRGDLLLTYDNSEEIIQMAGRHGFTVRRVPMMNTHHATIYELLIGRDLSWVTP